MSKSNSVVKLTPELIAKARADKKIRKRKVLSKLIPASEIGEVLGMSKTKASKFEALVKIEGTVEQTMLGRSLMAEYDGVRGLAMANCYTEDGKALLFTEESADDVLNDSVVVPFLNRVCATILELKGIDLDTVDEEEAQAALLDDVKKK